MNLTMTILSDHDWFPLILGGVTYAFLFVLTVQNSKRKILHLQERLNKVRAIQDERQAKSMKSIEQNKLKIAELEQLIHKLGDENSVLRLELEERKAQLNYANTVAQIESEKRAQAETAIFGSDIYLHIKELLAKGQVMTSDDWRELEQVVNSVYTNFTERLYSLRRLTDQEYHVTLLIKIHLSPKDISTLTVHSKESVATTRSRLYQKVFGKKGSSKDWDDFVMEL